MQALEQSDPEIWMEFLKGNFAVTKSSIPFVSIGADHACEQVNKWMKQQGGLIGISTNETARNKFFLIAAEMADIAKNYHTKFFTRSSSDDQQHHERNASSINRSYNTVMKIKDCINAYTNPFQMESTGLFNIVTKAMIPDAYVSDIIDTPLKGQQLYQQYVEERITSGRVSLWAPIKRAGIKHFRSSNCTQMSKKDVTDLKESKALFGRLMVIAKSERMIDLEEAIGTYEFSVAPRAFFASDASCLPSSTKSQLTKLLSGLVNEDSVVVEPTENSVAVVDGMALLHRIKKMAYTKTVRDLGEQYVQDLQRLTKNFGTIHLAFDVYLENSLKLGTRLHRKRGEKHIAYKINDTTNISGTTLKRLLSAESTKQELTEYLSQFCLHQYAKAEQLLYVSSAGRTYCSAYPDSIICVNNHEQPFMHVKFLRMLTKFLYFPQIQMYLCFFCLTTSRFLSQHF